MTPRANPFGGLQRALARSGWSPVELLLLVPTLLMALGFSFFASDFGKLGIPLPLPSGFGAIPNFQLKLFPMEIYLVWVGLLTLSRARSFRAALFRSPLVWLTAGLLAFGLLRALPDLAANPVLVVRNSAFVWYLSLPLMILLFPMPSWKWESFIRLLYVINFVYFGWSLLSSLFSREGIHIFWSIDFGLLLALAYGFCAPGVWFPRLAMAMIGFVLGLSYFSSVQRTTQLGLILTAGLLFVAPFFLPERFPRPRWRRVGWIALGGLLCLGAVSGLRAVGGIGRNVLDAGAQAILEAKPGRIAEKNELGLEKFRLYMWRDAWSIFLSHPMLGIGFHEPVVHRVYNAAGKFYDNQEGSFEQRSVYLEGKSPPIAGPHNSYLNALARLGATGGLFLLLHLTCCWLLFTHCYFASAFVLGWQVFYAFLNVGLEGPIRSFPLLLLVGAALRLSAERPQAGDRSPKDLPVKGKRNLLAKRVGLVHVPYRVRGGEDVHVEHLAAAYSGIGLEVTRVPDQASDLIFGAAQALTTGNFRVWDRLIDENKIGLLHLNNIHAQLGPAFLRWILSRQVPAIMTVHNHRFFCTNGLALYGSEVCKACRNRPSLLRPILFNCNGSIAKSIYHAAALSEIRGTDLLRRAIRIFIAPSNYISRELQSCGVPAEQIRVIPHPVEVRASSQRPEKHYDVLFLGRLSREKGIHFFLNAARKQPQLRVAIAGDGPERGSISQQASALKNVRLLGSLALPEAHRAIEAARVVCVPSVCQESFSLVAAEALCLGARLVVPDSQSFFEYTQAPYGAVAAVASNPDSLLYSIQIALEQAERSPQEVERLRQQFSARLFSERLEGIVRLIGEA